MIQDLKSYLKLFRGNGRRARIIQGEESKERIATGKKQACWIEKKGRNNIVIKDAEIGTKDWYNLKDAR